MTALVKLKSAEVLYWAMNPKESSPYFYPQFSPPSMTSASLSMVADAFRSLSNAAIQCWESKSISCQTAKQLWQANGLGICAIYCFSIGRFFPKSVIALRHGFGIAGLSCGFKISRLIYVYRWASLGQGSLFSEPMPRKWVMASAASAALAGLSVDCVLGIIKPGLTGIAEQTGLGIIGQGGLSMLLGVGSVAIAAYAIKGMQRTWKKLDI